MKNKILFVLSLLLGLMFINGGLNKLFNYIPIPDDMPESMIAITACFNQTGWLMELIAIVEIIGGILFIIPRFRALGAIVIFPIMIGILCTHIFNAPSGIPIAIILLCVNVWAIADNCDKYMPMIRK